MKKKFILSFEDFKKSQQYEQFEPETKNIMSFDDFVKNQRQNKKVDLIILTFDLSGTKNYRPLKKFLKINKFLTELNNKQPLTRNTYILPVTNPTQTLSAVMTGIVAYIQNQYKGKQFRVFGCLSNTYELVS